MGIEEESRGLVNCTTPAATTGLAEELAMTVNDDGLAFSTKAVFKHVTIM
jgi:hypothetical protein